MIRLHRILLSILLASLLPLAGCTDNYVGSVVLGELGLLFSARPIAEAASDSRLSEEQRLKLAFVVRARDYAEQVVRLKVGSSYQTFADMGSGALAWNLSASHKDRFEPYYWNLPVVGRLPYIGYFDVNQAKAERDRLVKLGYDTLVYEVDAFSTIGQLPDPVTSALLRRQLTSLADTVFHELTHNTIYSYGDTTFDESLATFVGRTAGLEFLATEFGPDAPEIEEARRSYEDQDRYQAFLQSLTASLRQVYDTDVSFDEKIARREAVIAAAQQRFGAEVLPLMNNRAGYETYASFPFNNAFLLAHVRYNTGQNLFAAVHESTGRDWAATLQIFRDAAARSDPVGYLQGLIP